MAADKAVRRDCSSVIMADMTVRQWSREIFECAGIDMLLMSEPVSTGTFAGKIKPEIAELTGISSSAVIVSMSHDQVAAAVGAGVFSSDIAVDGAGTVECITPMCDELPELELMYEGNFAVVPYVIPGKYLCYAFSYTGGALIQWCVDTLAKQEKKKQPGKEYRSIPF